MIENILQLRSIDSLLKEDFFIPDYQRGYRWTETEVSYLLNDIWKFWGDNQNASKEAFYCLQPIAVAPGENGWVVVDGQQRLTTIHLILTFLEPVLMGRERKNFGLKYQTRADSEAFLNTPDSEKSLDDVDYYHISQAYKTIKTWFQSIGGNVMLNFTTALLNTDKEGKNVKVIWYEINEGNADQQIDIFTRLNIGKILLTNAELVKALFLQKSNFDDQQATLKQLQIAAEWDQIERTLQQDEFWHFIYDESHHPIKYENNRIEYIFDLMHKRTREHESLYTFLEFAKDLGHLSSDAIEDRAPSKPEQCWLEVKRYFLTFEEWYQNRELYHLVGYLVTVGQQINTLKKSGKDLDKGAFKEHLKSLIANKVPADIDGLDYQRSSDQEKIRKVLLLFNIQTLLVNTGADIRFPFHRYKTENWDIEHIDSQTELTIKSNKARKAWIDDIVEYFTGKSIDNQLSDESIDEGEDLTSDKETISLCARLTALYRKDIIEDDAFEQLFKDTEAHFKQGVSSVSARSESMGGIGNLALLDEYTNRSYGNAFFLIKRKRIIENDRVGQFVPICTKNVFLKFYSNQFKEIMYWTEADAKAYANAIKETLTQYLTK